LDKIDSLKTLISVSKQISKWN